MRKKIVAILILCLLLLPSLSMAAEFKSDRLSKNEPITGDLYIGGNNVVVNGDVKGDLTAAGQSVTVNGSVDRDILATGGNLFFKGKVGDDIRTAGGMVKVEGECFGDLVVAGGTIEITNKAKIHGDLLAFGGTINVNGEVQGKTKIAGGQVLLNGRMSGNLDVEAGTLVIGKNAYIQGDLNYKSGSQAQIATDSNILGKISYTQQVDNNTVSKYSLAKTFSFGWFVMLFASLIIGLLLVYLMPGKSKKIVELSTQKFWKNLLIGLLILILPPLASLVLFMTIIGFMVALLLLLAYILLLIVASIYAGIIVGSWLMRLINKKKDYQVGWVVVLFGIVLLSLVKLIPILGWLVGFVLMLLALGSLVQYDYKLFQDLKKKKTV